MKTGENAVTPAIATWAQTGGFLTGKPKAVSTHRDQQWFSRDHHFGEVDGNETSTLLRPPSNESKSRRGQACRAR